MRQEADMIELAIFIGVLIAFSIFDIRVMSKANLKKEILPYLVLSLIACSVGLIYFTNPFRDSIANMILSLFNILR